MAPTFAEVDDKTQDFIEDWTADPWGNPQFRELLEMSWIFHDNALEGVVLSYEEIKQAIDGQVVPDGRLVPDFQEIVNYRKAIAYSRETAAGKRLKLDLTLIKNLHTILVENLPNHVAGRYRKDIPLHRTYYHDISTPDKIPYKMRKLLDHMRSEGFKGVHPVERASSIHFRLMSVFPFPEITGKVARLLMNLILLHHGYLPAVIHSIERQRYYEALRGPESALTELVLESMDNSLSNAIRYFQGQPPRGA